MKKRPQKPAITKRMIQMLVVTLGLFLGIFLFKGVMLYLTPHHPPPPISVATSTATHQEWQPKLRAIASLTANDDIDVTAELAGIIKKNYLTEEKKQVKKNELLVEFHAEAEIAQLESLRALAELADITYKRDKEQFRAKAISKATLDTDLADLKNKKAQVAQQEAIVAKKSIRAPFGGVTGIVNISPGQYMSPGEKIVTLQSLQPMYAYFSVPQQHLTALKVGQQVTLTTDSYPGETFPGKITTIEPRIDAATRNVQVEAEILNRETKLFPGMYGTVEIYTKTPEKHLTVPKTAVSFNPYGEIVYIVQENLTVKQAFITVGESRGDQIAILKGLNEGEQVVVAGHHKLKNGSVVQINNAVQPKNDPAPEVGDE